MFSPFHSKFWVLVHFLHSCAKVLVCLSSVCILQLTAAAPIPVKQTKNTAWNLVLTQKRKDFQGSRAVV